MILWGAIALLSIILLGLLIWLGKLRRSGALAVAAVMMLGLAGYALQGSPGLAAAHGAPIAADRETTAALILVRSEMDRTFSPARPYLIASDAFSRDGNYRLAAAYLKSGIRKNPQSADLWAGLGVQLMLASNGQMSPPALFAFDRVRALDTRHPAPDYFAGLTTLFDGKPGDTLRLWEPLLANAPADARWKKRLELQLQGVKILEAQLIAGENAMKPQAN
jgi:cytochrome c-type biogenesis protein CcmH